MHFISVVQQWFEGERSGGLVLPDAGSGGHTIAGTPSRPLVDRLAAGQYELSQSVQSLIRSEHLERVVPRELKVSGS